jgi:hypothetical protein
MTKWMVILNTPISKTYEFWDDELKTEDRRNHRACLDPGREPRVRGSLTAAAMKGRSSRSATSSTGYLQPGRAVAPIFTLFTEVPIPGKWRGYIIDNLNVSVDPYTLFFGEMAGVPKVPIGLYDYSGRLVYTVHSDRNGVYEALMPSTGTYNAPSPSGMFANVYYQWGNDPGPIDAPNEQVQPAVPLHRHQL